MFRDVRSSDDTICQIHGEILYSALNRLENIWWNHKTVNTARPAIKVNTLFYIMYPCYRVVRTYHCLDSLLEYSLKSSLKLESQKHFRKGNKILCCVNNTKLCVIELRTKQRAIS